MTSIEITQPIEKLYDFERVECDIIDGKYEGIYKRYEFNHLSIICNYKNGKKNGKYECFYRNGQLRQTTNYVDDLIQGESIAYFESGAVVLHANYVNNRMEGKNIIYYENGQPKYICNKTNGEIDGEYKMFWQNGQLKEIVNYILKNNNSCKFGEEKHFYSNGQVSMICNHIIDENNISKQDGPVIKYHYNGEVKAKYNILNDEYDGVYEKFNEQGDLVEYSEYIKGVIQPNY